MQVIKRTIPETNYMKGRQGSPITTLVMHWFGIGTLAGADARFSNPTSIVSAHYGISDETVYQWVDEADTSYGAGKWDMNIKCINLEHDATTTKNASDKTYVTSSQLVADICKRHSIPCDRTHIIRHSQVVATQCCGTLDIDKLVNMAKNILDSNSYTEELDSLRKELEDERTAKEDYKAKAEAYKETCQSQAEEIAKLNQNIKSLNDDISSNKAEILQLQQTVASLSTHVMVLTDSNNSAMYRLETLTAENKSLTDKLITQDPLGTYPTMDLVNEVISRIFGKKR